MQIGWLTNLLYGIGVMDVHACRSLHIPFGSSVFAVARKAGPPGKGGRL
jgi:hypothetical protein